eukprot:753572-Hanusia_phi.AAC.3
MAIKDPTEPLSSQRGNDRRIRMRKRERWVGGEGGREEAALRWPGADKGLRAREGRGQGRQEEEFSYRMG